MPTLMNSRGEMVDFSTGEVVGRAEGVPTTTTDPRAGGPNAPDMETQGGDRVNGLLNNLSWGFNSALFAIPDAAQRLIGKGMGMDEKQVFQFTNLFNKGAQAPRNVEERYARAVGEGVGGTMPFTGILAYAGAVKPLVSVAQPGVGILKGIANDAIKYVQQSPRAAAALDIAFGAGYEGLRQTVKENVDDSNPYKKIYEELLPAAAFIGLPVAAANLPSVRGFKFMSDKVKGVSSGLGEIEKETLQGLPGMYKLPIINVLPTMLMKRAENKLAQVFGPISESPEAQQALKQLEVALADPRVANAGFMFDAAEKTMYSPLVQRKAELLQQLGPKELEITKERINKNQQALDSLFASFSPDARKPIQEAFTAAQADRQQFFESLLKNQKDLTEAEVMAISERLGPQNIDQLNNELRGVLMADMEADFGMRQKVMSRLGMKRATNPDGTLADTRFHDGPDAGKSLPQYPAFNIEDAARSLVNKYYPARATKTLGGPVPEPIRILANMVKATDQKRKEALNTAFDSVIRQRVDEQLGGRDIPEDIYAKLIENVRLLVEPSSAKSTKLMQEAQRQINLLKLDVGKNEIPVATGIYGKPIYINPEQIKLDSQLIAQNSSNLDLNLPEALDLLAAAQRARHDAVNSFNSTQMENRGVRISDAQLLLDRGNAGFKDVEDLVLKSIPKARQEYDAMKMMLDDYNAGFEQRLPLLLTSKRAGGRDFLLPNEDLMKTAFKTAENLRQLQTTLGNNPQTASIIERGTIDWLRSKNVVTADGLVDPKKIRQVLDKNKNIVEALPANVQMKLQDEVKFADDYVKRMGELDTRRVNAMDQELDSLLAKATRPGADPAQTLQTALRDPATMQTLVRGIEKDPEMLAALRRSVFDVATGGAQKGGALKSFIDNNEASLKILFKNTAHLNDLKTLADLQRRVNAFADITGQIPAFESTDQAMKRLFGAGIQFLTTTAREAAVGRISPSTGALAIMLRMAGGLENQIYQRIFTRALEDAEFAKRITHISTPAEAKKIAASLEKIGIPQSAYVPNIKRMTAQEISQTAMGDQPEDIGNLGSLPVVPGTSAQKMLKAMPPAPPTRGTSFNPRLPTTPPAAPGGGVNSIQLMYPSLFPNDPISGLLQQRQAQLQAPRQ